MRYKDVLKTIGGFLFVCFILLTIVAIWHPVAVIFKCLLTVAIIIFLIFILEKSA